MTLIRWQPFRNAVRAGSSRDLLDEVFNTIYEQSSEESAWYPRVDIRDEGDTVDIFAELPGMKKEDFKVTFENNVLTLSGERKMEEKKDDDCYYCVERQYGRFSRSFRVPADIDAEKISAEYKDGILHLALPKIEAKKPREISIS